MKAPLSILAILAALLLVPIPAAAQTSSTSTVPGGVCINISNCIVYGPGESFSLWTTPRWSIFTTMSYAPQVGFSVVDSYHCASQTYGVPIAAPPGAIVGATCSGTDAKGVAFTMSYWLSGYRYCTRVGSGRGGGGVGCRWAITSGAVTVTQ